MTQLITALDVGAVGEATRLVDLLGEASAYYKVGLRLFLAAGPKIVKEISGRGHPVFLDLKFHDIPSQVGAGCREAVAIGARMLTVHAGGGLAMMRAAADSSREAAADLGKPEPVVLAVTALTSLDEAAIMETGVERPIIGHVLRLAELALRAGADGVVASALEAVALRRCFGDELVIVTPGIRVEDGRKPTGPKDLGSDQARTVTPAEAAQAGADFIVVGRPIVEAPDPLGAAKSILRQLKRS